MMHFEKGFGGRLHEDPFCKQQQHFWDIVSVEREGYKKERRDCERIGLDSIVLVLPRCMPGQPKLNNINIYKKQGIYKI